MRPTLVSSRPRLVAAVAGLILVGLAACDLPTNSPPTPPTSTGTAERPFTVLSTDLIRVSDPAAVTEPSATVMSQNVFQRLMTSDPGEPALKPDAARDCLVTAPTVYTCTLNEDLVFHNGHPLTSSDVKFSISRATRLDVPGSSAPLLASLRRIETPDPLTVRFLLSRTDTQFGWALASPAASIVDEEVYDADEVRPLDQPIVGSGPFKVERFDGTELALVRHEPYVGRTAASIEQLVYRTVPDSASIEEAMSRRAVDVVWRGLDAAAITRFDEQILNGPGARTVDGYGAQLLTGVRVRQLQWSPATPRRNDRALRLAISVALQGARTSDSIIPSGVPGHTASFELGGQVDPQITWSDRVQLTLGYDPTMPDGRDTATQIRSRLEDTGGLSVRLRPGDPAADLVLVDRRAWTPTALSWLQPYLESPVAPSEVVLGTLENRFRASTTEAESIQLMAALQRQSALDATVLPLSQSDETLYVLEGADVAEASFGPGWQLGLFGMRRV